MCNLEIRLKIKENRLRHYEVANALGVSEATLCRWLRKELNENEKQTVLMAIDKVLRGEKDAK